MTTEEAKEILACRRPSGADDHDPLIQGALALAAKEPELAAWAEAEAAFDRRLEAALLAVEPPPGLKRSLLMEPPRRAPAILPAAAFRWLAAAACMALVGLALAHFFKPQPTLAAFRHDLAERLAKGDYELTAHGKLEELEAYLARNHGPEGVEVPSKLAAAATHGCQIFNWRGSQVAMICFDGGEMGTVHLFVLDRSSLTDAPPESLPIHANMDGWASSAWTRGDKAYVAVARTDLPRLRSAL